MQQYQDLKLNSIFNSSLYYMFRPTWPSGVLKFGRTAVLRRYCDQCFRICNVFNEVRVVPLCRMYVSVMCNDKLS
jgi:hypothetical protein